MPLTGTTWPGWNACGVLDTAAPGVGGSARCAPGASARPGRCPPRVAVEHTAGELRSAGQVPPAPPGAVPGVLQPAAGAVVPGRPEGQLAGLQPVAAPAVGLARRRIRRGEGGPAAEPFGPLPGRQLIGVAPGEPA